MNFKQVFGKQLKSVRKARGMTQEELSELVDVHPRQISKLEMGENFPSSATLGNLCFALDVSPRELFDFDFGEHCCTYKATVEGNVVYLHERGKNVTHAISSGDVDDEMFVMAKNINRPIMVQYVNSDGVTSKTIEYFPDRTYKIVDKNKETEIHNLVANIRELSREQQYYDFFKLAVDAIKKPEDLDKLAMVIAGMKLVNKK